MIPNASSVCPAIHVASYRDSRSVVNPVDVTSHSRTFGKQLSPFYLGPVSLYGNYVSKNVENAWQYTKVYPGYTDEEGMPSDGYFAWAEQGWRKTYADRHPMGTKIRPNYSWWDGQKFDYISARKHIYIPLYAAAALRTKAFRDLQKYCVEKGEVTLIDFDGYDFERDGMSIADVVNYPRRSMGHSFVLLILLTGVDIASL